MAETGVRSITLTKTTTRFYERRPVPGSRTRRARRKYGDPSEWGGWVGRDRGGSLWRRGERGLIIILSCSRSHRFIPITSTCLRSELWPNGRLGNAVGENIGEEGRKNGGGEWKHCLRVYQSMQIYSNWTTNRPDGSGIMRGRIPSKIGTANIHSLFISHSFVRKF